MPFFFKKRKRSFSHSANTFTNIVSSEALIPLTLFDEKILILNLPYLVI